LETVVKIATSEPPTVLTMVRRNTNPSCDQAVFDGGHAAFVGGKAFQKVHLVLLTFCASDRPRMIVIHLICAP
jgi:hypothetical protein